MAKLKKNNKRTLVGEIIFLVITIVLNICAFPVVVFIGAMATDAPGSGMKEFLMGFFYIQGIPFLLCILSIILFIRKIMKKKESAGI